MPYISDEQLEQVREAVDIVQIISSCVPLKKAGRNYKGLCPFHKEKTPSFMVSSEKQIFHCFGCHEGGNAFHFLMKFEGIGFVEAVATLAEQAGIRIKKEGASQGTDFAREKKLLARVNRIAAEFYFNQLHQTDEAKRARDYLDDRKFRSEIVQRFLLGYAPSAGRQLVRHFETKKVPLALAEKAGLIRKGRDGSYYDFFRGRIIFPIRGARGEFIGFGGRVIGKADENQPKYLNTAESPLFQKGKGVYGLFEGRDALRDQASAIIVEGYFDVIALFQAGFETAVAPLGTALTPEQVKRLARHVRQLVVVFDGDAAGLKAAWRSLATILPERVAARVIALPQGEDPDSFLQKNGVEEFERAHLAAPGMMDYFIGKVVSESGRDNLGKTEAVRKLLPLLQLVPDEVEKSLYINSLSDKLGLTQEVLRRELQSRARKERNFQARPSDETGRHRELRLTPFEQDLLQALLSNVPGVRGLLEEVVPEDWRLPELKTYWPKLRESVAQGHSPQELLESAEDADMRRLLTGLMVAAEESDGEVLVEACRRSLQRHHLEARRHELTRQIREAEVAADQHRMEALLTEKNRLLKKMNEVAVR